METAISTRFSQGITGPRVDPGLERRLAEARSRVVDGVIPGGLDGRARQAFTARRNELLPWFRPAPPDAIEEAVAGLMTSFYSARSVSPMEAKLTTRKYAMDLEGLPLWAVREACSRIARGAVEGASLDFPPAAARLRAVADEVRAPFLAESFSLRVVLDAKEERIPDPEERMRVLEGLKNLGKALTATSRSEREATPFETAAVLQKRYGLTEAQWDALPSFKGSKRMYGG